MFTRSWTYTLPEVDATRFEQFEQQFGLPMIRSQKGCLGVELIHRPAAPGMLEYVMLSRWQSLELLEAALASDEWREEVKLFLAQNFGEGNGKTAIYDSTLDRHWSEAIFEIFQRYQIEIVSYVPDAGHSQLIQLCQANSAMQSVVLTTEEEGIALASGAYLGGKRAVLLMQSSGVGNCINMLSLITTCRFPFLTLVTMRGEWGEFNPWQIPMGQSTPKVLEASGLLVYRASEPAEVAPTVEAAANLAFNSQAGVAVLLSQKLIGTKTFGEK